MAHMAEIYIITNSKNGNRYIGKTTKTKEQRFAGHLAAAKNGYHTRLANAIRKYGKNVMILETLEEVLEDDLNAREIYHIANLKPEYNMTKGGDGGAPTAPETKTLLSRKGKKRFEASQGTFLGKNHTEEAKAKMSSYRLGKKIPDDTRAKLSIASTLALSKHYLVIDPTGVEHHIKGLKTFCLERGLGYSSLHATIRSGIPVSRGPSAGWLVR